MTPTIAKPEIFRPADSEEAISLDWKQAVRIASLLLREQYQLSEQDPMAAAETLALAARAAGRALTPILNTSREAIFAIPRGATELLITTPTFTPADFDPASTDRRAVGLALAAIVIDGQTQSPESIAVSGLHPRAAHDPHAWTTGKLRLKLPKNAERVTLHIATRPKTWHFNPKAA